MANERELTAAELMARLAKDPEYQRRMAEKAQRRAIRTARLNDVKKPLLEELNSFGYRCTSIEDLSEKYSPLPPNLVQTLVSWLPRISDERVLESIVRTLILAEEPFDGRPLVACFERAGAETSLRYAVANTIAHVRPYGVNDWIVEGVKNPLFGASRQVLVLALARMVPQSLALPILRSLLNQMPGHVAAALAEIGGVSEMEELRSQLAIVDRDWEKDQIEKAIRKIRGRLSQEAL